MEESFETVVAFLEWCFNFYSPKLLMLCTLIPIPIDDRFNRDAEEFNRYLNAYAKSHAKVILLDTALKVKDFIQTNNWRDIYRRDATHLDKAKGANLILDLLNHVLDYYFMDKSSIVTSRCLNDGSEETDRLKRLYIRDYHNFFRRRYVKLKAEAMQKGIEIPEVRLQERDVDEIVPEPWAREAGGKPPYTANYEAESPLKRAPLKTDCTRVRWTAMILRKASILKGQGILSPSAAKAMALDKLNTVRNLLPRTYKCEAIFELDVIASMAIGVRDGVLEDHRE